MHVCLKGENAMFHKKAIFKIQLIPLKPPQFYLDLA